MPRDVRLLAETWTFRVQGYRPADYLTKSAPVELTGCLTINEERTWFRERHRTGFRLR